MSIYRKLIKKSDIFTKLLKNGEICYLSNYINFLTYKDKMLMDDADFLSITPYDISVETKYKCGYINASFIDFPDYKFIACQLPKPEYLDRFTKFLRNSKIRLIISLNESNYYFQNLELVSRKCVLSSNREPFIYDEILKLDDLQLRRIHCIKWSDHSTLKIEDIVILYNYIEDIYNEYGINQKRSDNISESRKRCLEYIDKEDREDTMYGMDGVNRNGVEYCLVHCKAGIGRTGMYIFYKILKDLEISDEQNFLKILLYLRSRRFGMVGNGKQITFLVDYFLKRGGIQ